jgi:hypothetical protein
LASARITPSALKFGISGYCNKAGHKLLMGQLNRNLARWKAQGCDNTGAFSRPAGNLSMTIGD